MKRLGRRARKRRALSHPRLAPLERATCPESVDGWAYWSTRGHVFTCDEETHGHPGQGEGRYFRLVCLRCESAHATGVIPCGSTFAEARALVNAGDAARLALDAGDA